MPSLRKSLRVVALFAAIGFAMPWLLLVFYVVAHRLGHHPSAALLISLCPASIMSLQMKNAGGFAGLIGWFAISVSNAVLYAIPGIIVTLFMGVRKSN